MVLILGISSGLLFSSTCQNIGFFIVGFQRANGQLLPLCIQDSTLAGAVCILKRWHVDGAYAGQFLMAFYVVTSAV